jgi:hypothetical protein
MVLLEHGAMRYAVARRLEGLMETSGTQITLTGVRDEKASDKTQSKAQTKGAGETKQLAEPIQDSKRLSSAEKNTKDTKSINN